MSKFLKIQSTLINIERIEAVELAEWGDGDFKALKLYLAGRAEPFVFPDNGDAAMWQRLNVIHRWLGYQALDPALKEVLFTDDSNSVECPECRGGFWKDGNGDIQTCHYCGATGVLTTTKGSKG
jgi:hypothetical protein